MVSTKKTVNSSGGNEHNEKVEEAGKGEERVWRPGNKPKITV